MHRKEISSEMLCAFVLYWFRDSKAIGNILVMASAFPTLCQKWKLKCLCSHLIPGTEALRRTYAVCAFMCINTCVCLCVCVCIQNMRWWSRCHDSCGVPPSLQIKHRVIFRNLIFLVIQLKLWFTTLRKALGIAFCGAQIMMWMIIFSKISPSYYWIHHKMSMQPVSAGLLTAKIEEVSIHLYVFNSEKNRERETKSTWRIEKEWTWWTCNIFSLVFRSQGT